MAKGQKNSGREAKKPKASKIVTVSSSASSTLPRPERPLPVKGQGK